MDHKEVVRRRVALNIRRCRDATGLSQKKAAELIGCSVGSLHRYESYAAKRKVHVPLVVIIAMASVYKVGASELLGTRTSAHQTMLRARAVDMDECEERLKNRQTAQLDSVDR